jgi:WD40 repeat protein
MVAHRLAFTQDGRTLAASGRVAGDVYTAVKLWNVARARQMAALPRAYGGVLALSFTPDGKTLVAGAVGQALLWDVVGHRVRAQVPVVDMARASPAIVCGAAAENGSATLLTASNFVDDPSQAAPKFTSAELKQWSLSQVAPSSRLFQTGVVPGLALPLLVDGHTLLTSKEGELKLWDVDRAICLRVLKGPHLPGTAVLTPGRETLVSVQPGFREHDIRMWDLASGIPRSFTVLNKVAAPRQPFALSADGMLLAVGGLDHTVARTRGSTEVGAILIWDVSTGKELRTLTGHHSRVTALAFSADAKALASASQDGSVIVWALPGGGERATLAGSRAAGALAFSDDRALLAAGGPGGDITLWDITRGAKLCTAQGHADVVESLAFSPDGKALASASKDHTIRLWEPLTGQQRLSIREDDSDARQVGFSPDGKTLVCVNADGSVRLWDAESAQSARAR